MNETKSNKSFLSEFVYLRIILIVALVLYHSMCPYVGIWGSFDGMRQSDLYYWVGRYSYFFFLSAFVFMSGYLWGFSTEKKKQALTFHNAVSKKAKRLLLPSVLFSVAYCLMFGDFSEPVWKLGYGIVNGMGHLWFLPMLFWCFVAMYVISICRLNTRVVLAVSVILPLLPCPQLPFRISSAFVYFIYFYIGYMAGTGAYAKTVGKLASNRFIPVMLMVYVVAVFALGMLGKGLNETLADGFKGAGLPETAAKLALSVLERFLTLAAGLSGLFMMYGVCKNWLSNRYSLSKWLVIASGYCFGVYIYQQFILMVLYFKTGFAATLVPWAVPWGMFAITLALSVLLVHVTLKTKIGRYLIG